ncbi:TonB-dependent receptor, partial [Acidithiobacillus sp. GGI-221]
MTKMHSTALRNAVAFAVFTLGSGAAFAADESLGTVTGTAGAANNFFGSAPAGNVGQTPSEDLKKIQRFKKGATNAETLITKGQFDLITPTDSYTQALRNMPNTLVVSGGDSMDGDDIYINGFGKNLINFTLDGIPLNDNDSYTFYSNEF